MMSTTREHILLVGGRIIHHKGFTATGLQEILAAADVPKGSFYFYFKSKEDFGLALVDHYRTWLAAEAGHVLRDSSLPPLERLRRFFAWFEDYFAREGFIKGCPLGNLAQEMGDVNPAFRDKLHQALENLIRAVRIVLTQAAKNGEIPSRLDPEATARFIVSAWQGALVRMKAVAGPEPLDNFRSMVFDVLLT